jgi:hypothetical protein
LLYFSHQLAKRHLVYKQTTDTQHGTTHYESSLFDLILGDDVAFKEMIWR